MQIDCEFFFEFLTRLERKGSGGSVGEASGEGAGGVDEVGEADAAVAVAEEVQAGVLGD